jgi:tetratricopeptide (TPR) repeat protein
LTDGPRSPYYHTVDSAEKTNRTVRDAYRSLNRKKFQEAILLLENALTAGAGNIYVLLLLAVAYLHTDQFGKLARFITKMKEMDPSYLPLIQLEAFLKLKSASSMDDALRLYIELIAKYPADSHLHRGRNLISDAGNFEIFQKEARLQDFVYVPRPPRRPKKTPRNNAYVGELGRRGIRIKRGLRLRWRPVYGSIIFAAVAIAAIACIWLFAGRGVFSGTPGSLKKSRPDYGSIDLVSLSGTEYDIVKNIGREKVPVYYQSARDVTADFNRARQLIKAEKYNESLLLLNGLYNSNVNFVVKEKVDFLIKFVTDLEERDFDPVPFPRVEENRYRYRGYAVRWNGTVLRVRERSDSQILALKISGPGGESTGEADVYSDRIIPGLEKGARVMMEGVIVDFLGKDRRAYLAARNIKIIK